MRAFTCPVHSFRGARHLLHGARFQARDLKWIVTDPWKKENLHDSLWQLALNNRHLIPPNHFELLMMFCKDAKGWGLEHRKKAFWAYIGLYLHRGQKRTALNVNMKVSCLYCGLESNLLYILSDYNHLVYLMEMLTDFHHNSADSDRWDPQKLQMQTAIGGKTTTIVPCWLPPPPEEYDCWYNVARRTLSNVVGLPCPASTSTDVVPELLLTGRPGASQWRLAANQSAVAAPTPPSAAASPVQWRLAPGRTAGPASPSAAAASTPPAAAPVQQLPIENSQPTLSGAAFRSSNWQSQPVSRPQSEFEPSSARSRGSRRWAKRCMPPPPPPPSQHGDEAAMQVPPPPPPPPQRSDEAAVEVPQPKKRPRHCTSKRTC